MEVREGREEVARVARQTLGVTPVQLQPLAVIKHSITRYRISTEVFRGRTRAVNPAKRHTGGSWTGFAALEQLPFASAHKKIVQKLLAEGSRDRGVKEKSRGQGPPPRL